MDGDRGVGCVDCDVLVLYYTCRFFVHCTLLLVMTTSPFHSLLIFFSFSFLARRLRCATHIIELSKLGLSPGDD